MVLTEMQGSAVSMRAAARAYKAADYQRALEIVQALESEGLKNSETLLMKGMCLRNLKRGDESLPLLEEAARQVPVIPDVFRALSHAYLMAHRCDEALECAKGYIRLCPESCLGYFDAGKAHAAKFEYALAIKMYHLAVQKAPNNYTNWLSLGTAYGEAGNTAAALAVFNKTIEIFPQPILAHKNKSFVLLHAGNWEAGWPEYEWRTARRRGSPYRQPYWTGEILKDKTLFIRAEQGFGDALQFARYLPQARQRMGQVILECRPKLKRIFQENGLADVVVSAGEKPPAFDTQILMASLPGVFKSSPQNVPNTPYLRVSESLQEKARRNLPLTGKKLKVGLVWQGSVTHRNDPTVQSRWKNCGRYWDLRTRRTLPFMRCSYPCRSVIRVHWQRLWNAVE